MLHYYLYYSQTGVRTSPLGSSSSAVLTKQESAYLKWPFFFLYYLIWNCLSAHLRHQFRALFSLSKSSSSDVDCEGCNEPREFAQPRTRAAAPHPLSICCLTPGTEAGPEHVHHSSYRHLILTSHTEIETTHTEFP